MRLTLTWTLQLFVIRPNLYERYSLDSKFVSGFDLFFQLIQVVFKLERSISYIDGRGSSCDQVVHTETVVTLTKKILRINSDKLIY